VVRQLLASGILAVKGDHGTLALTDLSAEVLRGERQVMLRRDPPKVPAARSGRGAAAGTGAAGTGAAGTGAAGTGAAGTDGAKSRRAAKGRPVPAELPPEAEPAFERLRAWRAAVAKEQGIPPYVIFHDATLRLIATSPPSTLAGLASVNGVGETKLARYGQQILDVLADRLTG
jgi:ATP-dependent DNA helicase RecQ